MSFPPLLATGTSSPENLSIFSPDSPPAESIRVLFIFVLAVAVAILAVVWGVLFYSLFRFRRRDPGDGKEPPQVYGSKPIEIAWTAAPALIVFLLVLLIIRTVHEVRVNPAAPPPGSRPLYVTVIGHQWWWEYRYDRYDGQDLGGLVTANELHVPAGSDGVPRPIYLSLESADVCHSFWVPRLAGKTDLIPGRTNTMWFQTDKKGLYLGQCAEYCGTQHTKMLLRVYVDAPEEFDDWLKNQQEPAVDDPAVADGRRTFLGQSCVNCHRIRGTSARGTYAPDLTHLMSRQTLASGMIPNDRAELERWVANPQQVKPGCLMPAFGLDKNQFQDIVDYLLTLR
jgi:cytochrome c oxidase subunit 2